MANSARMSVQGLAELEKSLDNLSKSVGRSVLRQSLRKAAEPMKEKAKSLAPVDDGDLRDSIIIGGLLNKSQKRARRRLTAEERSAIELYVGPSYKLGQGGRHGHLVEFGTAPHIQGGVFKGSKHPGTAPQPFMRPAYDAEARPTVARLGPILMQFIERAAKRQAKRDGWEV
ncbi:HK97-gp10 family putative phage morphogenesis protein [Paracoccus laeviglucosivorans]|uniref:Phage protein, HK97 gp10 family n=1 Tax=Paracoccus laeviglucosivorans TaxID=1197861 RepID=A0A521CX72_9RHOB|nr:HK97-gp10 family putative phage morphogenesis protein [Paracoccus laeviglucosivorans]SMO64035.1 phage protein, HK97 gp10 family [Paracoccus laeviglucosivorans]